MTSANAGPPLPPVRELFPFTLAPSPSLGAVVRLAPTCAVMVIDAALGGCGCSRGVALDQNRRRWLVHEERSQALDHSADLDVAALVADALQNYRLGEAGRFEENNGELDVSVLTDAQRTMCPEIAHWDIPENR